MSAKKLHTLLRKKFVLIILFSIFYVSLLPFYYNKFLTFGCFDDCFNYMGGYFLLQGKMIFSEFFYNHQPLMAYLSYLIQSLTDPQGIYHLVLYHRLFIYAFSFFMGIFLISRLGISALFPLLVYESTKHYVFGDRFLAEGLAVYLLMYLFGLLFERMIMKKNIEVLDIVLSVLGAWAVVFLREPYIPLTLVLFALIMVHLQSMRQRLIASLSFGILCLGSVLFFPLSDYFFNVITVNSVAFLPEQSFSLQTFLRMFLYPLFAIFDSERTIFGGVLQGLSLLFVIVSVLFVMRWRKNILWFGTCVFLLGIANLRFTEPGKMYYEAFHMIIWYGLFLMMLFQMIVHIYNTTKSSEFLRFSALFTVLIFVGIFSPQSFYFAKHDLQTDFVTHYGPYVSSGEVVKILADEKTTLFLDGFDDMIYYHSGVHSSYKFSWFTSVMPRFDVYMNARTQMFENSPPDFYYGSCDYLAQLTLPENLRDDYVRFYFRDEPTCLHMKKTELSRLTSEKQQQLERIGYYLKGM